MSIARRLASGHAERMWITKKGFAIAEQAANGAQGVRGLNRRLASWRMKRLVAPGSAATFRRSFSPESARGARLEQPGAADRPPALRRRRGRRATAARVMSRRARRRPCSCRGRAGGAQAARPRRAPRRCMADPAQHPHIRAAYSTAVPSMTTRASPVSPHLPASRQRHCCRAADCGRCARSSSRIGRGRGALRAIRQLLPATLRAPASVSPSRSWHLRTTAAAAARQLAAIRRRRPSGRRCRCSCGVRWIVDAGCARVADSRRTRTSARR